MTDPAVSGPDAAEPPSHPPVRTRTRPESRTKSGADLGRRFVNAFWSGPVSRNLAGAIGTQLCVLVSGVIAARMLGPTNRGYLAIITAWPSAIGQIGAVGISLAATYFLSSSQIGGRELLTVLRRPVTLQVLALNSATIAILLGYIAISGAPILVPAAIFFIALPFGVLADYGFAFLLGARQHGRVNLLRTVQPGAYALLLTALYLLNVRSLIAATVSLTLSVVIMSLVVNSSGLASIRHLQPTNSVVARVGYRAARKQLLSFGRKGYIGYLSPVDTFRIDQLVIGFLLSPRILGFYVVGSAFTTFARLVAFNIGLSATPEIAASATPAEQWHAVRRLLLLTGGLVAIINVVLAVFVIVAIPLLFGNAYRSSIPIAEILLVAGSFLALKRVTVDSMRGAGETQVGTRAEMVNLLIFVILCAPLGLELGGAGVALALAVASACGSLMMLRRLRQLGIFVKVETGAQR